ncbi:MAG: LysM peptidoglycan-binding domain-containing protein [Bdellovibrionales bacterium]|nr:LysM peptidoglycan-binding domain-containing protein [Bdellovibrionales bacterium]
MKPKRGNLPKSRILAALVAVAGASCPISSASAAADSKLYNIIRGDSLSAIAKRLYGTWDKFKDLWEANKAIIANPDLIYPGQRLRLLDGTDLDLADGDQLADNSDIEYEYKNSKSSKNGSLHKKGTQGRRGYSTEWQLLPKQRWETFVFKMPPQIDPDGFDRRSRVGIRYKNTINMPATVASDRLAILGEITGGRTEHGAFLIGEQVMIHAEEELQVGGVYSITEDAERLWSHRDGRVGFLYRLKGKIRIVGVRDQVFVGTITQAYTPITRDLVLIQEVKQLKIPDPIPAPAAIPASIIEGEDEKSYNIAGDRIVYLDAGTDDGVKAGMIFRHYQHIDPYTKKELSSADFLVEAEMKVIEAKERFSTAIVLNARSPLHRGDEMVTLTDVSDLNKHLGLQSSLQEKSSDNLDELDKMDPTQGVGAQEDRDLRQLENASSEESNANDEFQSTSYAADDIQKVEVNDNVRRAVEIGREKGPNDESGPKGDKPIGGPTPAPNDNILDEPKSPPAPKDPPPTVNSPAEPPASTGSTDSSLDAPPVSADPFATDSFKDDAPVTEDHPNPPSDPLLNAIPDGTPNP